MMNIKSEQLSAGMCSVNITNIRGQKCEDNINRNSSDEAGQSDSGFQGLPQQISLSLSFPSFDLQFFIWLLLLHLRS